MNKVILIGAITNKEIERVLLREALTYTLAKALTVIDKKPHSQDELEDTVDNLIETLGYDILPDIKLSKDIQSIEREFEPKEESIVESIKILKKEGPWYNRFYKPRNHPRVNDKYKSFKPQTKKKGTRKK